MHLSFRSFASLFLLSCLLISAIIAGSCGLFEEDRILLSDVRSVEAVKGKSFEPFGVAFSGSEVYISDGANGKILKLDSQGKLSDFATGLKTPSHIAFSESGDLFVTDSGDHTIIRIDKAGQSEIFAGIPGRKGLNDGKAGEALFNAPVGIAVHGQKIFVADTYNDRIRVIEDGAVSTLSGSKRGFEDSIKGRSARFDTPAGLAMLGEILLVADTGNRRIRTVGAKGETGTLAGNGIRARADGLPASASFSAPTGIAVDTSGAVYISDAHSIRVIGRRLFPVVETLAGSERGFKDDHVRKAKFNRISGLAFDGQGRLIAGDSENGLIRILSGKTQATKLSPEAFRNGKTNAKQFRKVLNPRWPYEPASRSREIAGTLGEIRGEISDSSDQAWFHNGLDIVGGYGEKARMVRSEKILRIESVSEFGTKRENIRFPELGYIHIRFGRNADGSKFDDKRFQFDGKQLRVPRGAGFKSGEVIGTLNTMNHVHLVAGATGLEMNALDALILPGASDKRLPVIEDVELYSKDWSRFETVDDDGRIIVGNSIRLVAKAYDQMDGNADRRRLGVYKLGYQLFDPELKFSKGFDKPKWTIEFDLTPPGSAVSLVYAKGSRSGATGTTTFKYIVSNKVSGTEIKEDLIRLETGKSYVIRIFAADYFGNSASKDIDVRVK